MITMVNLTNLGHQPTQYWDEVFYKRIHVFCNTSARLSRYSEDIRAATAQYCRKLTCSNPVTLLHS